MPKVGKMKFPYTEQGMKDAQNYAKQTGKAMEMEGGGIIPKKDIESLEKSGVGKLYGPGTPVNETIDYITNWVEKNRR